MQGHLHACMHVHGRDERERPGPPAGNQRPHPAAGQQRCGRWHLGPRRARTPRCSEPGSPMAGKPQARQHLPRQSRGRPAQRRSQQPEYAGLGLVELRVRRVGEHGAATALAAVLDLATRVRDEALHAFIAQSRDELRLARGHLHCSGDPRCGQAAVRRGSTGTWTSRWPRSSARRTPPTCGNGSRSSRRHERGRRPVMPHGVRYPPLRRADPVAFRLWLRREGARRQHRREDAQHSGLDAGRVVRSLSAANRGKPIGC
jgi:hypothetical protein